MRKAGLLAMVIATLLAVSTTGHAATQGPPYPDVTTNESCLPDTIYVCDASASADGQTGAVSLLAAVRSRLQGYAPAYLAGSSGEIGIGGVALAPASPGRAVRIGAGVFVDDAAAAVVARPANLGTARAEIFGYLSFDAFWLCVTSCFSQGFSTTILEQSGTGQSSLQNTRVDISVILYSCEDLQPGAITMSLYMGASASIGNLLTPSAGSASASIDATVTEFFVEDAAVPDGACEAEPA